MWRDLKEAREEGPGDIALPTEDSKAGQEGVQNKDLKPDRKADKAKPEAPEANKVLRKALEQTIPVANRVQSGNIRDQSPEQSPS